MRGPRVETTLPSRAEEPRILRHLLTLNTVAGSGSAVLLAVAISAVIIGPAAIHACVSSVVQLVHIE